MCIRVVFPYFFEKKQADLLSVKCFSFPMSKWSFFICQPLTWLWLGFWEIKYVFKSCLTQGAGPMRARLEEVDFWRKKKPNITDKTYVMYMYYVFAHTNKLIERVWTNKCSAIPSRHWEHITASWQPELFSSCNYLDISMQETLEAMSKRWSKNVFNKNSVER